MDRSDLVDFCLELAVSQEAVSRQIYWTALAVRLYFGGEITVEELRQTLAPTMA